MNETRMDQCEGRAITIRNGLNIETQKQQLEITSSKEEVKETKGIRACTYKFLAAGRPRFIASDLE